VDDADRRHDLEARQVSRPGNPSFHTSPDRASDRGFFFRYIFSMVNFPKAKPTSTPRPVPASVNDTSPFVSACASADFPAPACASDCTYDPRSSSTLFAPLNFPVPSRISDLPKVMPPPVALSFTFRLCPLSQ